MNRLLLATAVLLLPAASPAATTIQGSATGLSYRTVDPGLVIKASAINFGPFTLDLDPGTLTPSFFSTDVLRIGTDETTVNLFDNNWNLEDPVPYDIAIQFTFTDPFGAVGGPVTGETFGVWLVDIGKVVWDNPVTFNFGNGGAFSLKLFDTHFATPGSANVKGKFTLLSESRAVPEPRAWAMMLLGFGIVGYGMRRKRRQAGLLQIA